MKKILLILSGIMMITGIMARVPQGITHQAVMRDSQNQPIVESLIGVRISILQGGVDGEAVYVETHNPITNANGLITYVIGQGAVESGVFAEIEWSSGLHFLKTEADPAGGTDYIISGVTQFLSVPYALHAKTAESFITKPPKAIATEATDIGEFSATLNGIVNGEGFSTVVVFEWGTTTEYGNTVTAIQSPVTGSDDITVYAEISGLQPATAYHYRIRATNAVDVTHSEDMMFTTQASIPQLNTLAVSDITPFSAVSGGNITYDGGLPVTQRGVVWSTEPEPGLENNDGVTNDGQGSGTYVSELSGLLPGTLYHIKAYALNIAGVAYGNQVTFTTSLSDEPALFSSAEAYCQGDPGVTFGVENSTAGETYNLQGYNDQNEQWQTIRTVIGNGATVLFTGQHQAGNYRLLQDIENEIEITEIGAPEIFEVTGGGGYCDNTTDYPVIGLSNSQPFAAGAIYELYIDGIYVTDQPGIGNAFNFANPDPEINGFPDPGFYTVIANIGECMIDMEGEAEVIVNESADVSFSYSESGPPLYCGFVEFESAIDGGTAPFLYKWHFSENDSLMIANPEFHFPAFGIGNETFEVSFEVTDDNGCVVSYTENITILQRPDASLNEVSNPVQNPPGSTTLAFCTATTDDPEGFFELSHASTTQDTNTWYEIIWGDVGSAPYEDPLFDENATHEYGEIGSYDLTFTVQGPTACVGQKEYFVYVGAEPDGGLMQHGTGLTGWAPFDFEFIITGTTNNPVGTQYYLDFGDGNDTTFYDVPPNGIINFTYYTCPTEVSQFGRWGFVAIMDISNACGYAGAYVYHIYVNCSAQAGFTLYEGNLLVGNGIDTLITEQTVSFINESTSGFFVTHGGTNYIDEVFYFWDFGDGHTSNEKNPVHTYEETNQWYEVSLTSWTSNNPSAPPADPKGYDTITKHIFIQDSNGAATVTDIDGNVYQTVIIGNQEWMAENLRVTRYNNEDDIPDGLSFDEWWSTTSGAYAIYDHNEWNTDGINSPEEMVAAYGKLYNWYAVDDSRGLCPEGWSVPSKTDWTALVNYVVSEGFPNEMNNPNGAGNALKSCRQVGHPDGGDCDTSEHPRWNSHGTQSGFDEFGFSALPVGTLDTIDYNSIGNAGYWWSSSEFGFHLTHAWLWFIRKHYGTVNSFRLDKQRGFGVRCFRIIVRTED